VLNRPANAAGKNPIPANEPTERANQIRCIWSKAVRQQVGDNSENIGLQIEISTGSELNQQVNAERQALEPPHRGGFLENPEIQRGLPRHATQANLAAAA